jgi:DNA-binding response OmpR family regulator
VIVQNQVLLILVVEDEAHLQDIVTDALTDGGYQAKISSSGEDAVKLIEADVSKYRALLTDVNLSGELTGWDVAKRARELDQDLPVVYMTGAAADQWASHGVPNSILLQKPFAPAQVVTAISQLLNQLPPTHE